MKNNKEKINVRDIITLAISYVVMFVIYAVVGVPLSASVYGHLFILSISALIWGSIFIFLYTRINKNGVCLSIGILMALSNLINFWAISLVIFIGAIIAEMLWRKLDKKKFSTMLICFTVQIVSWFAGMVLPLIIMTDTYVNTFVGYEEIYMGMADMIMGPMLIVYLVATIVGCIVGLFIGKAVMKKHFIKAGIV